MPNFDTVTLTTARLTLRPLATADADAMFAVFSDPEVTRYWSTPPWTDIAQANDAIAQAMDAMGSGSALRLGVVVRETGKLIGFVNLHHFFESNRRCEVGYAIGSRHWGCGYVSEALGALLGYGFSHLNLNRIEADIDPRNVASGSVLERLGFEREGYMKERWIVDGEVCDTVFYGLLRRNWNCATFLENP